MRPDPTTFAKRWTDYALRRYELDGYHTDYGPEEYLRTFDSLRSFSAERLEGLPIPEKSREFMLRHGLPESAAPYLSLESEETIFRTVPDTWGRPENWSDDERKRLARYLQVYSDGSGNPICIDTEDHGLLIWLDHDQRFECSLYVNVSIVEFAEFLLRYRMEWHGERCEYDFRDIDADALYEGAFWEVMQLYLKADQEMEKK